MEPACWRREVAFDSKFEEGDVRTEWIFIIRSTAIFGWLRVSRPCKTCRPWRQDQHAPLYSRNSPGPIIISSASYDTINNILIIVVT